MYKYIIIAVIVLILLIIINTTVFKGKYGEYKVSIFLKRCISKEDILLKDVILLVDNDSCQIDHLIISKKGIFVVETKNYSGTIYGTDQQNEWVQSFNFGKQTYKFYSPFKQNQGHIKFLKRIINEDIMFYNIIIFFNNSIENIKSSSVYTKKTFKEYYKSLNAFYSLTKVQEIYQEITKYQNLITSKEHIIKVEAKINDYNSLIRNQVCPKCGNKLIVKEGKYGKFYGCSNYPKCRFTKKVE
ncbi:MAG: NERD domain-containing protein [Bacilli bacterium]|nr:NERD domain-containing protein [Bacilli bacterium]